jgi:hypothetical protein
MCGIYSMCGGEKRCIPREMYSKLVGKILHYKQSCRCEDNIKMVQNKYGVTIWTQLVHFANLKQQPN